MKLRNVVKILPLLAIAAYTVGCGKLHTTETSGTSTTATASTSASGGATNQTLEGNWYSPCVAMGTSFTRNLMSFSTANSRVSITTMLYSDSACSSYKGNGSSPTAGSFSSGSSLASYGMQGTSLTITSSYGGSSSSAYYSYYFSGANLIIQKITWGHTGPQLSGSAVSYSR